MFEFFTGGGCPESVPMCGLGMEALGMLWAVLQDFRDWGRVRTVAALDPRFENRIPGLDISTLPADEVVCATPGKHEETYLSLLERCDAVLLIAPETDGILSTLAERAEARRKSLLGCSSLAAATAGDKAVCSRLFNLAGLPTPETQTSDIESAAKTAARIGCPLVVKPLDGVGAEGVCQINRLSDLPEALVHLRHCTSQEQILVQSMAVGFHASVSLLIGGGRCLPISLNLQLIEPGSRFKYRGSQVPFDHPNRDRAMRLAALAAGLIPGLKGYVGVDMVLGADLIQLIEINPRLTTSYIGLRQVTSMNLAQAIWECCQDGKLPDRVPLEGKVAIEKDNPSTWNLLIRGKRDLRLSGK